MALYNHNVKETDVVKIMENTDFNSLLKCVKFTLDIEDLEIKIKKEQYAYDREGFPKPCTNASTNFLAHYTKVKEVIFYLGNIVNNVNQRYFKLSTNIELLEKVLDIFVKFVLVHEMVHIQQMKVGKLTKEVINKEGQLSYEKRPLEREANLIATRIIGSIGELELIVAKSISRDIILDNNMVKYMNRLIERK